MWTYSINDDFGREVAHGEERSILRRHRDRLNSGLASYLVMWRPGTRPAAPA